MFKNTHKNGETHPDYVILPSTPLPAKPVNGAVKAVTETFVDDINSEEIPF